MRRKFCSLDKTEERKYSGPRKKSLQGEDRKKGTNASSRKERESERLQGQGKEETEGKVSKKSRRGRRSDRIIGLRV